MTLTVERALWTCLEDPAKSIETCASVRVIGARKLVSLVFFDWKLNEKGKHTSHCKVRHNKVSHSLRSWRAATTHSKTRLHQQHAFLLAIFDYEWLASQQVPRKPGYLQVSNIFGKYCQAEPRPSPQSLGPLRF